MATYLTPENKSNIFSKYGKSKKDTGSTKGQIALLTHRISHLSGHLGKNPKDFNTEKALKDMVSLRKRLIKYLQGINMEAYKALIAELGIRK